MRTVVVTGAAGAAGRPLVRRLAAGGTRVIAAGRTPRAWDDELVTPAVIDLLDQQAVREWAASVGPVDGVIHLVGGWRGGKSFASTDLADWAFLHDVLIRTLQHTTLAFAPLLTGQARVAIVSQSGTQHPTQGNAPYAAAKAAAESWTLALADSLRDTEAAATILVIKALATGDRVRPGWTHVDRLAEEIAGLWDRPAKELNGQRLALFA
ncbi:MAG: SDR family NAD(P)-dependent oxidoreductase [Streptosporangiaceae bacterium]